MVLFEIKKVVQLDYPDNGFKSTKLTSPGQDIGRQAGTNCIMIGRYYYGWELLRETKQGSRGNQ